MIVGLAKVLQQLRAVLYPCLEADAGTGGGDVGEIEHGQLLETVRTVFQLAGCRMVGDAGGGVADAGMLGGL